MTMNTPHQKPDHEQSHRGYKPPHRPEHKHEEPVNVILPGASEAKTVTFEDLGLHPNLLKGIHDLGFIRPTPIQAAAIPAILSGSDVIGCAQTGTGKTAAFVLPILHRLLHEKREKHLRALFLSPTRELALQSIDHLRALSKHIHLKGVAIFGGVPMNPQIYALQQGVEIISATPGRFLDHIYSGRVNFENLEVFVLDEVDRMLDMGFLPDIQRILNLLPEDRQNLVFSATMTPDIAALVNKILRNPVKITIGFHSTAAAGIRHAVYPVPRHLKKDLLLELLRTQEMQSVLIFSRTKIYADRLAYTLETHGFKVSVLHGDRNQNQRLRALEQFRRGKNQIMVATDIAARGIDVEDITHVINYDVPHTPEDYIHRIGRTARAEATGDAFTLMDSSEEPLVKDIERLMKKSLPRVILPDFDYKKGAPPKQHHQKPRGGPHRSFNSHR